MNQKDIDLYKQEIDELTTLLNTEWIELRDLLLRAGIEVDGGRLVSYFEDEEDGQYGVFITNKNQIIKFDVISDIVNKEIINNTDDIEDEFPQVVVALKY